MSTSVRPISAAPPILFHFDNPALLSALCPLWGFAIIGDGARFGAAAQRASGNR